MLTIVKLSGEFYNNLYLYLYCNDISSPFLEWHFIYSKKYRFTFKFFIFAFDFNNIEV